MLIILNTKKYSWLYVWFGYTCLVEITATSHIRYVPIRFKQLDFDMLAHCSWQHCSRSVKLEGVHE